MIVLKCSKHLQASFKFKPIRTALCQFVSIIVGSYVIIVNSYQFIVDLHQTVLLSCCNLIQKNKMCNDDKQTNKN